MTGPASHDRVDSGRVAKNRSKKAAPPVKKRVRDLERLLAKNDNLPADVKAEKERELSSLRHELATGAKSKQKSKMVGKYHMVRFFDRKKADRRLKKAQKLLEAATDHAEKSLLQHRVHAAEVDLNYALYFPLLRKYVMLFPKGENANSSTEAERDAGDTGPKGNMAIWLQVDQATREGPQALQALKNESPAADDHSKEPSDDISQKQVRKLEKGHRHQDSDHQKSRKQRMSKIPEKAPKEDGDEFFDYT